MTAEKKLGDMKAGLTGVKPKLSIMPASGEIYAVRGTEYGADKYVRGNYFNPPPATVSPELRLLGYIDATMRHLRATAEAINRALGSGGDVRAALTACVDDDPGNGSFPPSMLPHLAHAAASISIGISCGVDDGLLPRDPGRPWDALRIIDAKSVELPQKLDPASERRRVARQEQQLVDARVNNGAYDVLHPVLLDVEAKP